ncbi:MAG TPA: hypothetical protein VGB77_09340 [Abditibacteriaceae bacterium]|jgi:hypothetical protein
MEFVRSFLAAIGAPGVAFLDWIGPQGVTFFTFLMWFCLWFVVVPLLENYTKR